MLLLNKIVQSNEKDIKKNWKLKQDENTKDVSSS